MPRAKVQKVRLAVWLWVIRRIHLVGIWSWIDWHCSLCFCFCGGPRFRALGVDSGPRGGAFEGVLDPRNKHNKTWLF